jgi:hypothetical protein
MAFSLSSVSPTTLAENGGFEVVISGSFESGHRYQAFIGDMGTTGDYPCYSGIPEQGNYLYKKADGTLVCYSPILQPEILQTLTVKDADTAETHQLVDAITVVYSTYYSSVFNLRQVLPKYYKTGSRNIEQVPTI